MFSSAFSSAFHRPAAGYIGPVMAQAALVGGALWRVDAGGLLVLSKRLIGPAGKVFAFASDETAARWVENARFIGAREIELMASIEPGRAAAWKAKKREKLAVIAARVVAAAARLEDAEKRAALVAESDFCLSKWA